MPLQFLVKQLETLHHMNQLGVDVSFEGITKQILTAANLPVPKGVQSCHVSGFNLYVEHPLGTNVHFFDPFNEQASYQGNSPSQQTLFRRETTSATAWKPVCRRATINAPSSHDQAYHPLHGQQVSAFNCGEHGKWWVLFNDGSSMSFPEKFLSF